MHYHLIKVGSNYIGVVVECKNKKMKIKKIYLPTGRKKMLQRIKKDCPEIERAPRELSGRLKRTIVALYQGKKQKFSRSMLDVSNLTPFTKKVLLQASRIPRGQVVSYSSLAAKAGYPRAARAVGRIMACNPFPIVIPCHRVINSDGSWGGFSGGWKMKREMLKREGVEICPEGKIVFRKRS